VRALRAVDLTVLLIESDDAHAQARAANSFAAEVFVGLDDVAWSVTYYQSGDHSSPTGSALATRIAASLSGLAPVPLSPSGMRLPVLRETRMPAVVVGLGGPPSPEAAAAISTVVVNWATGSGALD
jgi:N-acetylmuramoyl-L-alanine amidase